VGVVGWLSMVGVLNITAAAWTAGFQWWRSGDITRTQNVSEYMLVLALCLVGILLRLLLVTCYRCPLTLSARDIHAALTASDRFDFLTNKYLGTPHVKDEML